MLKVGITGGIGSGKTTICKIFEILNIPIYYADDRAKALMVTDEKLIQQIKGTFGEEAYTVDGQLNRKFLADKVFKDKSLLKTLESYVHPAVFLDEVEWISEQKSPYVIKENAILFESGSYKSCDKVITVYAPLKLRIQRVQKRDNTTQKAIRDRINKQMPEREKKKLSDFIIYNNGKKPLLPQIISIHKKLLYL